VVLAEGENWQEHCKFDCQLVWTIFIFCWSLQDIGEWPENQILIPDWTYFHSPGVTLVKLVEAYKVRFDINLGVPDEAMFMYPLSGPGC